MFVATLASGVIQIVVKPDPPSIERRGSQRTTGQRHIPLVAIKLSVFDGHGTIETHESLTEVFGN